MSLARPLIADSLYYLRNFETALRELGCRDGDFLGAEERAFMGTFTSLAESTRALLVRLMMRKSVLVRIEALHYQEIGDLELAAAPLLASGWIVVPRRLSLEEFVHFFSKADLCEALKLPRVWLRRSKLRLLSALREHLDEDAVQRCTPLLGRVWQLTVKPLCDTICALYFGNFHQEWREFVLAALHVRRFERVDAGRPFQSAEQVQAFKALRECQLLIDEEAAAPQIEPAIPLNLSDCDWLEEARRDVIFKLARLYERQGDSGNALRLYAQCASDEARQRER